MNKKIENIDCLPEQLIENNRWYSYNPESSILFVFIHGFLSNSKKCWLSKNKIFWPDLVKKDIRFNNPNIFLAGYNSSIDSYTYGIKDCAREVIDALRRVSDESFPSPISTKNILFITHSLGGIIGRYVIEANKEYFKEKTVGIVLMASPSLGSGYYDLFKIIIKLFKNDLAKQLRNMSDLLVDLDDRFKNLIDSGFITCLIGAEAVEHHPPFHKFFLPNFLSNIVSKESAGRYFAAPTILAKTNHSTIVKPNNISHPGHLFLLDFYTNKFKEKIIISESGYAENNIEYNISPTNIHSKDILTCKTTNKVLFDVYDKSCKDYYIIRRVDGLLAEIMSYNSVWVSGDCGSGKTNLILRYLISEGKKFIVVDLAKCVGESTETLLYNIYLDLYDYLKETGEINTFSNNSSVIIRDIISVIKNTCSNEELFVNIDEIPISETSKFEEFISKLLAIQISLSNIQKTGNLKIIASSIQNPQLGIDIFQKKIHEKIKFLNINYWSNEDIQTLLDLICRRLKLNFSEKERMSIIDYSGGSPRFIKKFIRNHITCIENGYTFQQIIDDTLNELR